jgi:hypothetical protein
MEYKKAEPVKLKAVGKDEKWLQDLINNDPSILGLGDLSVYRREKTQPTGGRIDFVLEDPVDSVRYETEIMLGTLNESHIMRTIEYWDVERRRYPTLEHRAVIVAEDITNRFFNIISLMNKAIPIIAIQLNAFAVDNYLCLNFVKVLDLSDTGEEDEQANQDVTDRLYWEKRANPQSMAIMDAIIEIVKSIAQTKLSFNKGHIAVNTVGRQFVFCHPRKSPNLLIRLRIDEDRETLIKRFEEQGIECKKGARPYIIRVNLTMKELEQNKALISEAIQLAEKYSHQ